MIGLLIGIIIILLIALFFSVRGNINLTKQCEAREEESEELQVGYDFYVDLVDKIRERMLQADSRLTDIDIRGAFEADDEVGFVFKEIKKTIEELNQTVKTAYE